MATDIVGCGASPRSSEDSQQQTRQSSTAERRRIVFFHHDAAVVRVLSYVRKKKYTCLCFRQLVFAIFVQRGVVVSLLVCRSLQSASRDRVPSVVVQLAPCSCCRCHGIGGVADKQYMPTTDRGHTYILPAVLLLLLLRFSCRSHGLEMYAPEILLQIMTCMMSPPFRAR